MKRTLSLLLSIALATTLLVCPAAAAAATSASAPWAQVSGQSIALQGLPGHYNGIQLTLTLNKPADSGFQFAPSLSGADSHTFCTASGNTLTLYISSKGLLNQDGALALGSLAGQGLSVSAVSALKFTTLASDPADTGEVTYDRVEIRTGSSQGGSSSGSNGGSWGGSWGGGGALTYPVGTSVSSGGGVQISSTHAAPGETVTLATAPEHGYILNSLSVTDSAGRQVAVARLGDGKWSFVMPAGGVTVSATFSPAQSSTLPFADVAQGDWFRDAVAYVYAAQLMNGTEPGLFGPGDTTTRAMIVTILHRYEGSPTAGIPGFPDVPRGEYYAAPVAWAAANGVVNGYETGLFGPEDPITREQMAAILYRYAQSKGLDVSGRANLSAYADAWQISPYARDAMAWAVHTGLITGVDSYTLQPGGSAIRAQVATILMRFCQYAETH